MDGDQVQSAKDLWIQRKISRESSGCNSVALLMGSMEGRQSLNGSQLSGVSKGTTDIGDGGEGRKSVRSSTHSSTRSSAFTKFLPTDMQDLEDDNDEYETECTKRSSARVSALSKSVNAVEVQQLKDLDDDDTEYNSDSTEDLVFTKQDSDPKLDEIVNRIKEEDNDFSSRHSESVVQSSEEKEFNPETVLVGRLSQSVNVVPTWKPLSSDVKGDDNEWEKEPLPENDIRRTSRRHRAGGGGGRGGIGNLWKSITQSFVVEQEPQPPTPKKQIKEPKKEISGAKYFRKGKKMADKCRFLEAVALYNFALVRQREDLGEDHLDCGTTLNEIGVAWMMLGERYPALTALEEALYIRQKALGDGAMGESFRIVSRVLNGCFANVLNQIDNQHHARQRSARQQTTFG